MKLRDSKQKIMTILLTLALPFASLSLSSIIAVAQEQVQSGPGADGGAVRQASTGELVQIGNKLTPPIKKLMLTEIPGLQELNNFFNSTSLLPIGPIERHSRALMPSGERQYYRVYDTTPFTETINKLKQQYSSEFGIQVEEVVISAFTQDKKTYLLPAFYDSKMTANMQLAILFHESLWVYSNLNFTIKPTVKQVVIVETAFYNFLKNEGLNSLKFNYEFYQQLSYFHNNPYILLYAATFDHFNSFLREPTRPENFSNYTTRDISGLTFFDKDSYEIVDPETDWRARRSIFVDNVQISIHAATAYISKRMPHETRNLKFLQALLEVLPNMSIWNQAYSSPEKMFKVETALKYKTNNSIWVFPNKSGGDGEGCIWVNQSMYREETNETKDVSFCIFATAWVVGSWENEIDLTPIKDIITHKK